MNRKKILIAEDNADMRHVIRLTLGTRNLEFIEAASSDAALQLAQKWQPDVLILDVVMPGELDGYQVCARLKLDGLAPATRIIMLTARTGEAEQARSVGADHYVTKPFSPMVLLSLVHQPRCHLMQTNNETQPVYKQILAMQRAWRKLTAEKELAYRQQAAIIDDLHRVLCEREAAFAALNFAHQETLRRLTLVAAFKDNDTGDHIVRMARYCSLIAEAYGMDHEFCELIEQAAPMHDIGKIGIPDSILKKPGPLTASEWQIMRQHPEYGAKILGGKTVPLFNLAAEIALAHHEKFDGSGYPAGLCGETIPIAARIAALADFFDALTMDRCYRPAFSDREALRMVSEKTGTHFDPAVVAAFSRVMNRIVDARDSINREQTLTPFFNVIAKGIL